MSSANYGYGWRSRCSLFLNDFNDIFGVRAYISVLAILGGNAVANKYMGRQDSLWGIRRDRSSLRLIPEMEFIKPAVHADSWAIAAVEQPYALWIRRQYAKIVCPIIHCIQATAASNAVTYH
jgi:hypothetical protein